MAIFNVSAWFLVDIDVPGDPESDEYQDALDEVVENLEVSHALLTTSLGTYTTNNLEVDFIEVSKTAEGDAKPWQN